MAAPQQFIDINPGTFPDLAHAQSGGVSDTIGVMNASYPVGVVPWVAPQVSPAAASIFNWGKHGKAASNEGQAWTIFGNAGPSLPFWDGGAGGEIIIPRGSMINAVQLTYTRVSGPSQTQDFKVGLLLRDGNWNTEGFDPFGFYTDMNLLPYPTGFESDVVLVDVITEDTFATGTPNYNPSQSVIRTFGDGTPLAGAFPRANDFAVGLTAKVQEWIDRPEWNSLSDSGTYGDLICFTHTFIDPPLLAGGNIVQIAAAHRFQPDTSKPRLSIDWTPAARDQDWLMADMIRRSGRRRRRM